MKFNSILKEVLEKVTPPKEDLKFIDETLKKFLVDLNKRIGKLKVDVFIGGSFAKDTVIKKDYYDVDVFLRFDKKYEDISSISKKFLKGMKNVELVHGSRDYFRIQAGPSFFIELIPVVKVNNPKDSNNITDLSYSHVKYIKNKVKKQETLDGIRLAKAFCYACKCYGAESYINGFSGYALELLVAYYGNFVNFIKAISKIKKKEVIDIEKHHKKSQILMDLNAAKLHSPIVLIDPTFKQRNALAALSLETFEDFQKKCVEFLKKPSLEMFEVEELDLDKEKKKSKGEFIALELKTSKQKGDVAGSKLLKFYKHLRDNISKYFDVGKNDFEYGGEDVAKCFYSVKSKKEVLVEGPFTRDEKSVKMFKKNHKKFKIKKNRIYALDKVDFTIEEFISKWKVKNKKRMDEMSIIAINNVQ